MHSGVDLLIYSLFVCKYLIVNYKLPHVINHYSNLVLKILNATFDLKPLGFGLE